MKSTGIVRKIDELGRIVLPIELRRTMKMQIRDEVEITAEDDRIILKKYQPKENASCIFCSSQEGLRAFKEHWICQNCMAELLAKKKRSTKSQSLNRRSSF